MMQVTLVFLLLLMVLVVVMLVKFLMMFVWRILLGVSLLIFLFVLEVMNYEEW